MNKTIAIKVNGVDHEVTIAPRVTLIEILRDHLHLTGRGQVAIGDREREDRGRLVVFR